MYPEAVWKGGGGYKKIKAIHWKEEKIIITCYNEVLSFCKTRIQRLFGRVGGGV